MTSRVLSGVNMLLKNETIRSKTRPVNVGGVTIGGGAPVAVQSMTNVPMDKIGSRPILNAKKNLEQIKALVKEGCELVRVAIPNRASLEIFSEIAAYSPIPVIADVHFDYQIAIGACRRGASAIRINPGNIGSMDKVDKVIEAASASKLPIRIGVNAGSLDKDLAARTDLTIAEKLAESAVNFIDYFESRDFANIVVSIKANQVSTTVDACRILAKRAPHVPQHLGITEAGTKMQGAIKSASGLGILLYEGIGDTIRVSLTADPVEEIPVAYQILSAVDVRQIHPEIISCPTCSRCRVNLIPIAGEVEERLKNVDKPLKVAVMGCEVNGPGEARDADCGVACGEDSAMLFVHGEKVKKIPADSIVEELVSLIETL